MGILILVEVVFVRPYITHPKLLKFKLNFIDLLEVVAPRPTPKLEDHPFFAVCD